MKEQLAIVQTVVAASDCAATDQNAKPQLPQFSGGFCLLCFAFVDKPCMPMK